MEERINKRIKAIKKSLENTDIAESTKKANEAFVNDYKNGQPETMYKHISTYAKNSDVTGLIWQEFIVNSWLNTNIDNIENVKRKKSQVIFEKERADCSTGKKNEKWQCRQLKYKNFELFGELLDYQVPLKEKTSNDNGELDIVARCGNDMKIIEYKTPSNTEPLLRAVLEVLTYYYQIGGGKDCDVESEFLKSFNSIFPDKKSTKITMAIVLPKDRYKIGHKKAFELIEKYNIECYYFENYNAINANIDMNKLMKSIRILSRGEYETIKKDACEKGKIIYDNSNYICNELNNVCKRL